MHLEDVMVRRSGWHYYHSQCGSIAELSAAWMAEALGWDRPRQEAELNRYQALHQQGSGAARQ